jgi:uncharacterized protein YecE (DUF72 family)
MSQTLRIGTAGWTIPKQHLGLFPLDAESVKPSHLMRCASGLNCVEVNSSFHRPHRHKTWERWAETTPENFRFAVKAPKAVTHTASLRNTGALWLKFFAEASGLGEKFGPLLVQLPPKLVFEEGVAYEFFTTLRELHTGPVVLEPRNESWFSPSVDRLLRGFEVARAAADPPKGSSLAAKPGGWPGLRYWRLHGAPRTYYSEYDASFLASFASKLQADAAKSGAETWVIFDNTALGHGTANAMQLARLCSSDKRARARTPGEIGRSHSG